MAIHEFECIDGHTCGNPVRLVVRGAPELNGRTQAERRLDFIARHDWIRTGLMFEPRGHAQMSGAFLYPATRDDCDVAVLYIETSGCLPMCGHGTIGVVTMAIEHGLVTPRTPGVLQLDTPAGKVTAQYQQQDGKVTSVKLRNVPSFLYMTDVEVTLAPLGRLKLDIAYGGNFYPIVEAQENYRDMADYTPAQLVAMGNALRDALNARYEVVHPLDPAIRGIRHVQWTGAPKSPDAHAANAVLYGAAALDRSPCGTGTSARMAQRYGRGLMKQGDVLVHESLIGSKFIGTIEEETEVAGRPAIVPGIAGWAIVTGYNRLLLDEADPYVHGFEVG
ncbi:MAG: 4-hydroxyproline epimerase [Paludibacterium sp.]|uniref:4-hydroxyproline epimerase n=1 Tax=Paludibacterium sp. TaxID=1917523 RepID=UPI0025F1FB98|nr:4-hydroxyproline epimerase [Paludibacterium sp.]MBV8047798.1 4-hydroxyproline epimerase [Paludibacterium sp.]MBV8646674.1 4-hydroxyproline epimerase [Paludibacterium sp.]